MVCPVDQIVTMLLCKRQESREAPPHGFKQQVGAHSSSPLLKPLLMPLLKPLRNEILCDNTFAKNVF